jgi:hypothetical protein
VGYRLQMLCSSLGAIGAINALLLRKRLAELRLLCSSRGARPPAGATKRFYPMAKEEPDGDALVRGREVLRERCAELCDGPTAHGRSGGRWARGGEGSVALRHPETPLESVEVQPPRGC